MLKQHKEWLDHVTVNFLELADHGACRYTNPEYYRGIYEVILYSFQEVLGDDGPDVAYKELSEYLVSHPLWKGSSDPYLAEPLA